MSCTSEACVTAAIENLCTKRYGSVTPQNMRALLMSYDGNGDGSLNRDELKRLLRDADALAPWPVSENKVPDAVLGKMDTGGDGAVSWNEFVAVSPKYAGATDGGAPVDAPPAEDGGGGLLTINRIIKPRISERNLSRTVTPVARIDEASAQVKQSEFPVVPVAVGVTALGLLWLVVR